MPIEPSAMLIVEIGSITTRVTLIDAVEGEARLIGQAEAPSTIEPPNDNAVVGVFDAAAQLFETTGRRLLQDDALIMPQTNERDGVNGLVITTSAMGPMGVVIAAVSSDVSARSALHASRTTYTSILQVITLDDPDRSPAVHDMSWVERQVQKLIGLRPDIVVIAGGLEEGAEDALVRLAHIVGLTALNTQVDAQGQQRQQITRRPVLFAGNSQARERVITALSDRAMLTVVDNVRPSLETERLDPARREISRFYNERFLSQLPGAANLQRLSTRPIYAACDAIGLMTRFVAERYGRATLALDAGSTSTSAFLYSQGRYTPAVLGAIGGGFGIGGLLAERSLEMIARWLPFPIDQQELAHWLLNKMLRPHILPATRKDLLIEHAVAREALSVALAALWDERSGAPYDLLIAGGGVLAHAPHPGLAALTILDALQPRGDEAGRAIEMHVDALSLLQACGALAFAAPDSALTLFERDLLNNTPLATCIVVLGGGRPGEPAVEVELRVVGGGSRQITVRHGQIARLPLTVGRKAQITLRPAGGAWIGRSAPGAPVASEEADVNGSALGVIIDARGRPLRLPDDPLTRQQCLWDWLVALGVESGPLPYGAAAPLATPALPSNGAVVFVETPTSPPHDAAPAAQSEDETPQIHDSLARLRQTVEEPKKRGFFRRK